MRSSTEFNFRNLTHENLAHVCSINRQLHVSDPSTTIATHLYGLMKQAFGNIHYCTGIYKIEPFSVIEHEVPTIDKAWTELVDQNSTDHPIVQNLYATPATETNYTRPGPFQSTLLYNEIYNHLQAQHQMWTCIIHKNEILTCIFSRDNQYSEKEITMLQLMLPHLEQSWKHWKKIDELKAELQQLKSSLIQPPEAEAKSTLLRKGIDTLTDRQRDVVELLASGMDNQQIADELAISKLTVKKHLQAVFQSLEISHRTELAAKWHQAHSVAIY